MFYKVIKLCWNCISGGNSCCASIDEVLKEVGYYRDGSDATRMHAAIREWASSAKPGDMITTLVAVIVAARESPNVENCCPECGHDNLDYGGIDMVENGNAEQEIWCHRCGQRWKDIFVFVERRPLISSE